MGKTYKRQAAKFEDENSSGRSGKHSKHANGKKTGGTKSLKSYVEENYDFEDSPFDDELEINDEIHIQHIKNKP